MIDGMEITQFTYFQQVVWAPSCDKRDYLRFRAFGSCIWTQDVYDLEWGGRRQVCNIFRQPEREHSVYAFEQSNSDLLFTLFTEFEQEAHQLTRWSTQPMTTSSSVAIPSTYSMRVYSASDRAGYLGAFVRWRSAAQASVAERSSFPPLKIQKARPRPCRTFT